MRLQPLYRQMIKKRTAGQKRKKSFAEVEIKSEIARQMIHSDSLTYYEMWRVGTLKEGTWSRGTEGLPLLTNHN